MTDTHDSDHRDLDWEGSKPTCPVCETWAEVA